MSLIGRIKEEIRVIKERDPAIHSNMEVFLYPSFKVMMHYRLAHKLYMKKHYFWARLVSQRGVRKTTHAPEYMTGQIITLDGGWQT